MYEIKITDQDANFKTYSTIVDGFLIEFGGYIYKQEKIMTIDKFDISGAIAGKLGIKKLFAIGRSLCKKENVEQLIIHGAKRTSGRFKGKIPNSVRINFNAL